MTGSVSSSLDNVLHNLCICIWEKSNAFLQNSISVQGKSQHFTSEKMPFPQTSYQLHDIGMENVLVQNLLMYIVERFWKGTLEYLLNIPVYPIGSEQLPALCLRSFHECVSSRLRCQTKTGKICVRIYTLPWSSLCNLGPVCPSRPILSHKVLARNKQRRGVSWTPFWVYLLFL